MAILDKIDRRCYRLYRGSGFYVRPVQDVHRVMSALARFQSRHLRPRHPRCLINQVGSLVRLTFSLGHATQ